MTLKSWYSSTFDAATFAFVFSDPENYHRLVKFCPILLMEAQLGDNLTSLEFLAACLVDTLPSFQIEYTSALGMEN